MGHPLNCQEFDTRGDPADAVPSANKMMATTSHLVGILGPSSDEALATVPLIDAGKIPMFVDTGQAAFDQSSYKYFWRITPADDVKGWEMGRAPGGSVYQPHRVTARCRRSFDPGSPASSVPRQKRWPRR